MPEVTNVGEYTVTHHVSNKDDVVIVFASAGRDGMGQPVEEFKNTIKAFNVSMIFVLDPTPTWFNRGETMKMFDFVASLAKRYRNVAVLGESMGASGSLTFGKFFKGISRILAFAPQYSVSSPFIEFDDRFRHAHKNYDFSNFWTFTSDIPRDRVQILCGVSEWRDIPHVAMYASEGYSVNYLLGAGHLVGHFLKMQPDEEYGNKLKALLASFLNFSVEFTTDEIRKVIGSTLSKSPICKTQSFAAIRERESYAKKGLAPVFLPAPPDCVSLTRGGKTDQSSVSSWSKSPHHALDAAGAISDKLHDAYGFHTDKEDDPWWSVMFSGAAEVKEVHIYNRIDDYGTSTRGLRFIIELSINGEWREVFRKENTGFFGGIDGTPFVFSLPEAKVCAGLRIKLLGYEYMHFQRVNVFGNFLEEQPHAYDAQSISEILKKRFSFNHFKKS
ncbi:hypothetical protein JK207_07610 [Gluconobacter cerinus]|uniref:hypothetical protein n=1 Tax=Gluconobacter cerinus TaxID=38307 RepID=UPI001B8BCA82|nr:hypothetical protein [Gluconobacter cerinus]MBS1021897.1 hypothetical protein [Gluconobacter cerinus]